MVKRMTVAVVKTETFKPLLDMTRHTHIYIYHTISIDNI